MRHFLTETTPTKTAIAALLAEGVNPKDQTPDAEQLRRHIAFVELQEQAEKLIAADPPERYIY